MELFLTPPRLQAATLAGHFMQTQLMLNTPNDSPGRLHLTLLPVPCPTGGSEPLPVGGRGGGRRG